MADLDGLAYQARYRLGTHRHTGQPLPGRFDNNGHTISNLFINRSGDSSDTGLFGYTGVTAKIWSLGLGNANVHGGYDVGALVGENNGQIAVICNRGCDRLWALGFGRRKRRLDHRSWAEGTVDEFVSNPISVA